MVLSVNPPSATDSASEVSPMPRVIASWKQYLPSLITDRGLVGGKAVGLLRLPPDWVPPFLVLTREFYRTWGLTRSSIAALGALSTTERSLIDDLFRLADGGSSRVMVRSSSPDEDLSVRGAYKSYIVRATIEDVAEAVQEVLSLASGASVSAVIQMCVSPGWSGHMSNERRVSQSRNRWLVESPQSHGRLGQEFIVAAYAGESGPLFAQTYRAMLSSLRKVAGTLGRIGDGRFHCEWVWSGNRTFIVQADESISVKTTCGTADYFRKRRPLPPKFAPRSCIRDIRQVESGCWRKLERPKLFIQNGLPVADVFVLRGDQWLSRSPRAGDELADDFRRLCEYPVVVRCDVARGLAQSDILLPTSPAITNPEELARFLDESAQYFSQKGVSDDKWAFLIAFLVPLQASAMVHARPQTQRVRVDAIWGFADGLLHFPHDTWYYYPARQRVRPYCRYKPMCLLPSGGKWLPTALGPPYDWRPVLSGEEVECLANWAIRLATGLGHEIELMCFARIGGARGPKACLPWHYTEWPVPTYSESVRALPRTGAIQVIERESDVERLRKDGPQREVRGYLVSPVPELLRDSQFLEEAASLAVQHQKPLYFQGSLLGHAYYIMSRAGAVVIPVSETEPPEDRQRYNKLVRDRIPVIVSESGGLARVRSLLQDEARPLLAQKLIEEAFEVWNSRGQGIVGELADVLEVVDALRVQYGLQESDLDRVRQEKRAKRGGFEELIFLEETAIRSLKEESDKGGLFPLFADMEALPSRRENPSATTQIRVEPTTDALELLSFSCPLVPPVAQVLKAVLSGRDTGHIRIEVEYRESRLLVKILRKGQQPEPGQLLLFSEAEGVADNDNR